MSQKYDILLSLEKITDKNWYSKSDDWNNFREQCAIHGLMKTKIIKQKASGDFVIIIYVTRTCHDKIEDNDRRIYVNDAFRYLSTSIIDLGFEKEETLIRKQAAAENLYKPFRRKFSEWLSDNGYTCRLGVNHSKFPIHDDVTNFETVFSSIFYLEFNSVAAAVAFKLAFL